MTNKEATHLLV